MFQALFAEVEQHGCIVKSFAKLRSKEDVTDQRQHSVGLHGFLSALTRPLQESVLKGVLARSQTLRVATRAQTLLRQMAEKVTRVEGRIPRGEHVEIEDVQTLAVQNDLVCVEISMDPPERGLRDDRGKLATAFQNAFEPGFKL